MPYILSRVKIRDYDKWFASFNSPEGKAARKASGAKSWHIFQSENDPNEIVALIEWDNLETAKKYYHDKDFLVKQPGIGVLQIWIDYLEEIDEYSV